MMLLLIGCISPHRVTVVDVDADLWNTEAQLRFDNEDTLGLYDLYFVIRRDATFTDDAVDWQVSYLSPDTLRYSERVTFVMPPTSHRAGFYIDTAVCYRQRIQLQRCGSYQVTIRPIHPLRGVHAVGVDLRRSVE
jgi:hypothetical protein